MRVVVIVGLVLLGAWLVREWQAARQRATAPAPKSTPPPPRHQRVSDAELGALLATLSGAVAAGLVAEDDAAASLARQAGLEHAEARRLLRVAVAGHAADEPTGAVRADEPGAAGDLDAGAEGAVDGRPGDEQGQAEAA